MRKAITYWLMAIGLVLSINAAKAESDYTPFGDSFNNNGAQASNCLYNASSSNHWCDGTGSGLNAYNSGMGVDGTILCTGDGTTPGWLETRPDQAYVPPAPDPNNYSVTDCWLYTGSNPSTYGYIVMPTNQPLKTGASPHYALALCTGTMATTEVNYQFSTHYSLGNWLWNNTYSNWNYFFLIQDVSIADPNSPYYPNKYISFQWVAPAYGLEAYHAYSVHLTCQAKVGPGS